jgi:uroporphyrin-III C-methyltransferase
MGLHHLGEIMSGLLQSGCHPQKPVALIESDTYRTQRTLKGTVAEIATLAQQWKFRAPTIIVVSEVVRLAKSCDGFTRERVSDQKRYASRYNMLVNGPPGYLANA